MSFPEKGCSAAMKFARIQGGMAIGVMLVLAAMQSACVNTKSASINPEQRAAVRAVRAGVVSVWQPLAADGLHDPKNPSLRLLQEPGFALSTLSGNKERKSVGSYAAGGMVVNQDGNKVDWVQALRDDLISPRRAREPSDTAVEREELVMDMDMFLDLNGSMPMVRFPHLAHTMWLACANCHPDVFVPQAGANRVSMEKILSGEQCGICHRAVSFPPTDCARCHSVSHDSTEAVLIKAQAREKAQARAEAKARAEVRKRVEAEAQAATEAGESAKLAKPIKPIVKEKGRGQPKGKQKIKSFGVRR